MSLRRRPSLDHSTIRPRVAMSAGTSRLFTNSRNSGACSTESSTPRDPATQDQVMLTESRDTSERIGFRMSILYQLVNKESGEVLLAAEDIRNYFMEPDRESPQTVTFAKAHQVNRTRRKTEHADLQVVNRQGEVIGTYYLGRVAAAFHDAPSVNGDEHPDLDYDFFGFTCEYPQAGEIWRKWASGGPVERGEWSQQPSEWHESWLHVVQTAWFCSGKNATRYETSAEATLDGTGIATRDAFYCALGEAVNGPGGYFGSNLDALFDCLRKMRRENGPSFRLVWQNFSSSREALGDKFTDTVLSLFRECEVETVVTDCRG